MVKKRLPITSATENPNSQYGSTEGISDMQNKRGINTLVNYHQSVLIVDKENHKIYHYDPNRDYTIFYSDYDSNIRDSLSQLINKMLDLHMSKVLPFYTFEDKHNIMSFNDPKCYVSINYTFARQESFINSVNAAILNT